MTDRWIKVDLWWIEEGRIFKSLRKNNAGSNIAALKTYIAIALEANFKTRNSQISYSQLEEITGLSRPMVARAIKILIEREIIKKDGIGRGATNSYQLIDKEVGWAKLPYQSLKSSLKDFSNRGVVCMYALKNLLVIAKFRDNKKTYTQITHETLVNKTGTPTNKIKAANDILITHGLIRLVRINDGTKISTKANIYGMTGLTDNRVFTDDEASNQNPPS